MSSIAPGEVAEVQVLYVTNFEVTAAGSNPDDAAETLCLQHLGTWIGRPVDSAVPHEELLGSGHRNLMASYGSLQRSAEWERVGEGATWATRVEKRDIKEDASEFMTRVTVGSGPNGVTMRVSMARDLPDGGMTPTTAPVVIQPGIVADIASEASLRVKSNGQLQDGRYIQVRTPAEVEMLAISLRSPVRLPILLTHTRTLEAQAAALRAAQRLVGLVRVVTLDYHAAKLLSYALPGITVPYAGGILVWTEFHTPPMLVGPSVLNSTDPDALRQSIMARVAPLSVLTGGVDLAYREARRAQQAAEVQRARDQAREAIDAGSTGDHLHALEVERDRANERADYYETEWFAAQSLADDYGHQIAQLQAQVEQLTLSVTYMASPTESAPPPDFDNCPEGLATGNSASLEELIEHLEQAASGHIVFTPNATASWERAESYPTPDDMLSCLVKLARMSATLYAGSELSLGHLDTWARENFDLKISLQDDGLQRRLRKFTYDDTVYDRTPHVKVNDGVPEWACGRIYFGLDSANGRVIVDHVGLHL